MRESFLDYLEKSGINDDIRSVFCRRDFVLYSRALRALQAFMDAHALFEHELAELLDEESTDER